MKILVACEESQTVTIRLRDKGHEAWSCDIMECSGGHPEWHLQQDVEPLLHQEWDMIIAFPPCTHLAVSGAAHFAKKIADGRQQQGIDFFMLFANCPCSKMAIENPIGIMSSKWRKPDQIVNPYQFGESINKKTCLWLKNLPLLKPTKIVPQEEYITYASGKRSPMWHAKSGGGCGKKRSVFFKGMADAMADQWGSI